jgi:hypothetical protein
MILIVALTPPSLDLHSAQVIRGDFPRCRYGEHAALADLRWGWRLAEKLDAQLPRTYSFVILPYKGH